MAPLSGKQHREYLKFQNKEAREASKMGLDEMRKQQLHQIKLQEATAKANQGLGHRQQVNNAKLKDMGVPLPKGASINKQKLGIPSTNPMAGTGMFKQGQHRLSQSPIFKAQGTDTVPAMLTPGEAVIPEPAAQDPKNKKAIKRMVQEGRKANRLRDGAVNIVNSDAPAQARYHAQGTQMVVPSLAYEHPDVPGSSFMNGTMSVPDFKRGSSAQANYANGTYGVVPQQVQSAVGYQYGTVDADIDEERKLQNVVPMVIQPASTETIPIWDERRAAEGDQFANMVAVDNRPIRDIPMVPAVATPVADQIPTNTVITSKEIPPVVLDTTPNLVAPAVTTVPAMFADQVQAAPAVVAPAPTVVNAPLSTVSNQAPTEQVVVSEKAPTQNAPVVVDSIVPPKADPYAGIEPTLRKHYLPEADRASRKVKSIEEIVAQLHGEKKTEKSFTDSLANLFTASGFKEELGLNNQDIIRMAISTAIGAKKFGVNRALAYAGKQAFEESSKRNAQQQADNRAIRTAAVQLHGQELRDARAEETAIALQKATEAREDFRFEVQRRDQAWRDTKEDVKAQRTMLTTANKEFNDLIPYVPKDMKSVQQRIVKETEDLVVKARKSNDIKGEYDAWTYGALRIAQIADKTPKGTVVRNETPVSMQPTVVRNNNTGENVTAYYNPKTTGYIDSQGKAIDMSRHTPFSTNKVVDDQVKDYLKSSIPTHTMDSKGKSVKIDNHDQVVTAGLLAAQEMGINTRDPVAFGQIASQGFRLLEATKKPITPENMAMAMHASTVKLGADSVLSLIKRDTTNNKNFLQVASEDEQLKIASDLMVINKRLEKEANRKIPMQKVMLDVETEFNNFKAQDIQGYNKFMKELPLNQSPSIAYYNKRLEQVRKEKEKKE